MPMTITNIPEVGHIHALLAERGYAVSETAPDTMRITEVESGVAVQAVLAGDILYLSLTCTVVPRNFCKLQDMGPEDEDDILSCVHFLLVDVITARRLLADLKS
ncbi:MAG: hypothetical protein ABSG26_18500 [Bryobacteraceae bacterium]